MGTLMFSPPNANGENLFKISLFVHVTFRLKCCKVALSATGHMSANSVCYSTEAATRGASDILIERVSRKLGDNCFLKGPELLFPLK